MATEVIITIGEVHMENPNKSSQYGQKRADTNLMYFLDDMWKCLMKYIVVFPIIILVCGAIAVGYKWYTYRPVYRAYTSFAISSETTYGYSSTYYTSRVAKQLGKTFPYILSSGALQQIVSEDLGYKGGYLPASISATAVEGSALFTIETTSTDPQAAYDVLQSVVRNYPAVAEYVIGQTQLEVIDESGVPTSPSNPKGLKAGLKKGVIIGGAISLALMVLYALTRNTVRDDQDLKSNLALQYLGPVPHIKQEKRTKEKKKAALMGRGRDKAELGESMRTIRSHVLKEVKDTNTKSIMITSTSAGEGKTTFAINLAISLSRHGETVIVIDSDLRNPSVASTLDVEVKTSTAELLSTDVSMEEALIDIPEYKIQIVGGKPFEGNAVELYGSEKFNEMINFFSKHADFVIVDAPPCGFLVDASTIAKKVDSAIFVVKQDYTRIDRVLESVERLSETGVNILGYILNDTQLGITGYGYNYGYGYGYGYGYSYRKNSHYQQNEE